MPRRHRRPRCRPPGRSARGARDHRVEHALIRDPPRSQLAFDHRLARPSGGIAGARHRRSMATQVSRRPPRAVVRRPASSAYRSTRDPTDSTGDHPHVAGLIWPARAIGRPPPDPVGAIRPASRPEVRPLHFPSGVPRCYRGHLARIGRAHERGARSIPAISTAARRLGGLEPPGIALGAVRPGTQPEGDADGERDGALTDADADGLTDGDADPEAEADADGEADAEQSTATPKQRPTVTPKRKRTETPRPTAMRWGSAKAAGSACR